MRKEFSQSKVQIDENWFDEISSGNQDAFKKLYEVSYRPLYAFLLSLTQNAENTKDLMQETYIQIYKNCHRYEKNGNPMAWMMKIGKNLFLMQYRKEHLHPWSSFDELEEHIGMNQIENLEDRILIEKIFSILQPEEQQIIILHLVTGLKFREIADFMDRPTGTILAKYNRCIRRLQKEMKEKPL